MAVLPRPALRRVITALACVGLLVPAFVGGARAQSRADLGAIEERIEEAQAEIERLEAQSQVTVEEFEAINARLIQLQADLDALNAELAAAQAVLEDKERIVAATTAELEATEARLAETRSALDRSRAAWRQRIRQSYINARPARSIPVFDVADAGQFAQASRYMDAIVSFDRRGLEAIAVLQTQIAADEAELARLRARQDEERAAAQAERDRVNTLVEAQAAVVAQVEAEAEAKRAALAQLEADRGSAESLVAALEAESAQIEAELAARAAQQAAANAGAFVPSGGGFAFPCSGPVGSGFGYRIHPISGVRRFHAGVDIGCSYGQPIWASRSGTVVSAGVRGGYGNAVVVDHGGGIATLYAHQSSIAVSGGQTVSQGQVIGYIGSTGYSTGPHLHFEVRVNGTPQNPLNYL